MALEYFIEFNLTGINDKYFVRNGRNILSTKYRQCKAALVSLFTGTDKRDIPEPPYKISIQSEQYHDIDAFQKVIFDALEEADIITNDRYILKLEYLKMPIKRGGDQSHFLRIETYESK